MTRAPLPHLRAAISAATLTFVCAMSPLRAQQIEASEVFAETLHEVRAVRGLAVGRSVSFEALPRAAFAALHAKSVSGLREDARIFALLGALAPRLDASKTYGATAARMLEPHYETRGAKVSVPQEARKLGRYVQKLLGAYAISLATDSERYKLPAQFAKATSFDERFVLRALLAGGAATTMAEWAIQHHKGWTMPERLGLRKWEAARLDASVRAPRFFAAPLAATVLGRNFILRGKGGHGLLPRIASGSSKRIEAVWKARPQTSEQLLHPEKFSSPSRRDAAVTMRDPVETVQEIGKLAGQSLVAANTLGEFGLAIAIHRPVRMQAKAMARAVSTPRFWSSRATQGWGGDRIFVFGKGKATSVAMITVWDSERDAKEFAGAFHARHGKRLAYTSHVAARLAVFANGALAKSCARVAEVVKRTGFEQDGKPYPLRDAEAAGPGR